jgi:hypothetical protein
LPCYKLETEFLFLYVLSLYINFILVFVIICMNCCINFIISIITLYLSYINV